MVFNVDLASKKVFASIGGGERTDRYECVLDVCDNPTCRCRAVHMTFIAEPTEMGPGHDQKMGRKASIDLDSEGVYSEFRKTASDGDLAFCETLIGHMTDLDFRLLGHLHFTMKNLITEQATPNSIYPRFDFTAIKSSKQMQVYNDVLPFGDRLLIAIDGVENLLLDQHCVRVGCDCTETYIELAPLMADGSLGRHTGTIMVDYESRQWQSVPDDVAPHDLPGLRQLIENETPDFYDRLSRRHARLQAIYTHCRKRHLATQLETKMTLPKKVGRNDPCPCGSGKKYKKCCMQ